jgi:cytochrome c
MKPLLLMLGLTGVLHATETAPIVGDADRGRRAFAACAACHREASAEVPNPGPDLRRVVGRPAGSVPGFRYSRALRNAKRTWNEETLFAFLGDPQAAVPGNTMPFPGLPDEAERRDLIAYLKTFK